MHRRQVGMDMRNLGSKKVLVITDRNVARLSPVAAVEQSLKKNDVPYKIWDGVDVEPTDVTFQVRASLVFDWKRRTPSTPSAARTSTR